MPRRATATLPANASQMSEPSQLVLLPKKSAPRKPSSQSKKVRAKTFASPELEDSFVHYCQLAFPEVEQSDVEAKRAKRIASTAIEFIADPVFESKDADSELLGSELFRYEDIVSNAKVSKAPDLPAHLSRLCEAKLLTPDEEKRVFHRMNYLKFVANRLRLQLDPQQPDSWSIRRIEALLKASDWYRDTIVKSNMRLVISIVKKFVNTQNVFDDLLSDGIVALLRAVDKFDVGLGFRFSTYATQVVRRNAYRKVMEKQNEKMKNAGSLHENGIDISDELRAPTMSEERWHELRSRLTMMLTMLDRREKFIIRARFSLGGHRRVQTLQRLAEKLGVSKERIRQLEKRALDKLRGMTEANPLPETEM